MRPNHGEGHENKRRLAHSRDAVRRHQASVYDARRDVLKPTDTLGRDYLDEDTGMENKRR